MVPTTLLQQRKLTLAALIVYWPALFVISHIPIPYLVRQAHVSDKSLHFVAYLILAFLLWFAFNPDRRVNWQKAAVWWVLLVIAVYGIVDELLQGCISGRSCDTADYIADLVGTLTGLILFSLLGFWPAMFVATGIVIFALTNVARANLADLMPVANAMFNFFAYAFFTVVWIQNVSPFLTPRAPSGRWIITALILPMAFLLVVRVFSALLGKAFMLQDVALSVAGIAAAVFLVCILALFRRTNM
jgi:VanZ family protein